MRIFKSSTKRILVRNVKEHQAMYNTLNVITYIILLPIILLDLITRLFECIVNFFGNIRTTIVNYIFKMIYWNELPTKEDGEDEE